jgi:cytochrome P450
VSASAESISPTEPPSGARKVIDVVDIDLTSGGSFVRDVPHAAFDRLRAAGGVAWHDERPPERGFDEGDLLRFVESPGFWVVTSHAHVTEVLRNSEAFSSQLGGVFLPSLAPESLATFRQMMLNMDPPEHVRLRRILQPIFTPRAIERLRASIVANADEIVDDAVARGECDLVTSVSAEMPLRVLADLLGMPREDRHRIFEWSNALIGFDNPDTATHAGDAMGAIADLLSYGQAMADARRAEPLDDIVSMIVNAEVDGERLDDTEFAMFWLLLVVAGNETTRNALSGSVVALHEHELWQHLAEQPALMSTAVDELLRYVSPVMHFRRTATADTLLGDQLVRAGDKVVIWYGAANRDPDVFDDPHALDLARDPNPHVAFGVGPHFCLGAHLARLEMAETLGRLLAAAPSLTIDGPVQRVASNFINGISHLPVRVGAR